MKIYINFNLFKKAFSSLNFDWLRHSGKQLTIRHMNYNISVLFCKSVTMMPFLPLFVVCDLNISMCVITDRFNQRAQMFCDTILYYYMN